MTTHRVSTHCAGPAARWRINWSTTKATSFLEGPPLITTTTWDDSFLWWRQYSQGLYGAGGPSSHMFPPKQRAWKQIYAQALRIQLCFIETIPKYIQNPQMQMPASCSSPFFLLLHKNTVLQSLRFFLLPQHFFRLFFVKLKRHTIKIVNAPKVLLTQFSPG